jgi:hypothetical protein
MDTDGNQLRVDDLIIFNAAADYYRESYVAGWITKISSTGALDIDVIKLERLPTNAGGNYDYNVTIPNGEDITGHIRLIPKRGRDAGPGNYRYDRSNVYVKLYQPDMQYVERSYD